MLTSFVIQTYNYISIGLGLVTFVLAVVLVRRGVRGVTLFRLATWCLLPLLLGYAATFGQQRAILAHQAEGPFLPPQAIEQANQAAWTYTCIGAGSSVPGLIVCAVALARMRKRPRPAR